MNAPLKPCHKCGAPALVENGNTDETWKIVCSREGCRNPEGETAETYWQDYLNGFEK